MKKLKDRFRRGFPEEGMAQLEADYIATTSFVLYLVLKSNDCLEVFIFSDEHSLEGRHRIIQGKVIDPR